MAAITTAYLLNTLAEAIQRAQADYLLYVPNATWTYVLQGVTYGNLNAIQTVINDTVDVNTRIYATMDNQNGQGLDIKWLSSQAGIVDLTPPVMENTMGGRNTETDWTAKVFDTLLSNITIWCGGVSQKHATQAFTPGITGVTFVLLSARICGYSQTTFLSALIVRKNPATVVAILAPTYSSMRGGVGANVPPATPFQPAVMERIAAALEAIVMSRIDVTLNHGGQVYSATTQTGP